MSETLRDYIEEKISEIQNICEKIEYKTEVLDMEEYQVPTILIYIDQDDQRGDIVLTCNVVPMKIERFTTFFIQFYMCISNTITEEKKQDVYKFMLAQNDRLMIGNLTEFNDTICVKYALYFGAKDIIDEDIFAKSLDIFIYQANVMSKKIDDILNDRMTPEEVLESGTFVY